MAIGQTASFGVYLQISSNALQPATLKTLSCPNLRVLFIINKYIKNNLNQVN